MNLVPLLHLLVHQEPAARAELPRTCQALPEMFQAEPASFLLGGLPGPWPLQSLEVEHCDNLLTDAELTCLLAQLPQLRRLALGACISVSDTGVEAVAELPQLVALSLDGAAITGRGLLALAQAPRLSEVLLRHTALLTPSAVAAWLSRLCCPLRALELTGCLDDASLQLLAAACPGLEHLSAEASPLTNAAADTLGRLTRLTSLSLRSCSNFRDAGLAFVAATPGLRHLDLVNTGIGDAALAQLAARAPSLGSLAVGLDASCHLCPSRNISSRICAISDEGLRSIGRLSGLSSLRVMDCDLVTSAGLAALTALRQLGDLELKWNVDDEGLRQLCSLPKLRRLSLSGARAVSSVGLCHLQHLPSLTDLQVSECHDLAQLAPLTQATALRRLSLSRCHGLGPAMLPALLSLTRLRELRLGSARGKEAITATLREEHPRLRELTFTFATTQTIHL